MILTTTIKSWVKRKERLAELEQQLLEKADEHSRYIKKNHLSSIYNEHGGFGLNAYTSRDRIVTQYAAKNKLELFLFESQRLKDPCLENFTVSAKWLNKSVH